MIWNTVKCNTSGVATAVEVVEVIQSHRAKETLTKAISIKVFYGKNLPPVLCGSNYLPCLSWMQIKVTYHSISIKAKSEIHTSPSLWLCFKHIVIQLPFPNTYVTFSNNNAVAWAERK